MSEMPEKIGGGFDSTAGPVFSRRGYLLFSDRNRILKWERDRISVFRANSNRARGNTFDHQGRLLTCEDSRVTRTEKNGTITVLARGVKAPHDVVYAIDGSIYFSDPPAGTVYQVTRHGGLRAAARDCERPAGVALAPNQRRLYVTDSAQSNVRVYDIAGDGALTGGRIFCATGTSPGGLKTDESGSVWIASAAGIRRFHAAGRAMEAIPLPEEAGNCNWGEGFRDLYVTAGGSLYRIRAAVNGTRTY
jgi:gluconolactonase